MEPWPQYHNYATLATMAFGVFLWLILWVLLHSNIAINHHIIYKLWWTSHDIEPTCQFEGFQKQPEEIWHDFGPLWVCAACQTQCAMPWVCVAPIENLNWGLALCAPRPCVYVPRSLKLPPTHSNTYDAWSHPLQRFSNAWISTMNLILMKTCISNILGSDGLNFCFSKNPFF